MEIFLRRIIWFACTFFCLLLVIVIGLNSVNNKKFNNYKINKNINSLFIGDSHIQQSMDDKVIPHSINVSLSAEPYYFSFLKLKCLLDNNSSINKVFLGFSYHNLSSYCDDYLYGSLSNEASSRYFFILPNTEKVKLLKVNSNCLYTYFRNIIRNGTETSYMGKYDNWGKAAFADQKKMMNRLVFHFYKDGKIRDFSESNLNYLNQIIKLCSEKNISLTLLTTPLHPYYKKGIPNIYIVKYNTIIEQNKIPVIDFKDLNLTNDSCFMPDGDHVSKKGSVLISKYIGNSI